LCPPNSSFVEVLPAPSTNASQRCRYLSCDWRHGSSL
jgi:hypothetical protein